MKKILILIVVLLIIVLGVYLYISQLSKPVDANDTKPIAFTVQDGVGTSLIASDLYSKEAIRSELVFKIVSKMNGYDGQYKVGTYTISKSMTIKEIMALFSSGKTDGIKFTIPEGYNLKQIAEVLSDKGIVTEKEFIQEVANGDFDYKFIEGLPKGENRLEGYLYPDTYIVSMNPTAHQVIDIMLAQFDNKLTEKFYDRAKEMGITINDAVILASVIERESVVAEERSVMAGVFYNRMEIDMPLQSCATIQYILGEQKQFLTTADTQIESPYNTYINKGLPPAPICSPRIESIEAALYPDDNEYIFFVLKPDLNGRHNFSKEYEKFLKDKEAYNAAAK